MAWNVNQIKELAEYLINKEQTGSFSPTDFFYSWNSEQRSYQSDLLGRFQARATGKEGANTGLIQNEKILTALSPFTKLLPITVSGGFATKPSDYAYTLAMRVGNNRVIALPKSRIYAVLNSVIDPPSAADGKYYFTEYATNFKVFPTSTTSIDFEYIADCRDVIWGFQLDANQLPVYDAGNSVQPQWANAEIVEITKRALKNIGVHFSSMDFENYGASTINTGN